MLVDFSLPTNMLNLKFPSISADTIKRCNIIIVSRWQASSKHKPTYEFFIVSFTITQMYVHELISGKFKIIPVDDQAYMMWKLHILLSS